MKASTFCSSHSTSECPLYPNRTVKWTAGPAPTMQGLAKTIGRCSWVLQSSSPDLNAAGRYALT